MADVNGRFDFPIRSGLSLIASPITSIGAPLTEPQGVVTKFFIPINIFKTTSGGTSLSPAIGAFLRRGFLRPPATRHN